MKAQCKFYITKCDYLDIALITHFTQQWTKQSNNTVPPEDFTCSLFVLPRSLTESCPDRYWGASLSMLGLMGDVTEMDGRSIF